MTNEQTNENSTELFRAAKKRLDEMNLLDDFLFQQILLDDDINEDFCRIILNTILGKNIHSLKVVPQKSILGIDTDKHGIRLDAYIEDTSPICDSDILRAKVQPDIYDIEPNRTYDKASLPKRMRYYNGIIDSQLLSTSTDYDALPNVITILILPYDPFNSNRMIYTVQNQCIEDPSIPYNDGFIKIYLYAKGTEGNPSQNLRDMLKYMEKSDDENAKNSDIQKLHKYVTKVKSDKKVGINYMKSWEWEQEIAKEAVNKERANTIIKFSAKLSAEEIAKILDMDVSNVKEIINSSKNHTT